MGRINTIKIKSITNINASAVYVLWHMIANVSMPGATRAPYLLYQALWDHGLINTYFLRNNSFESKLYLVFRKNMISSLVQHWHSPLSDLLLTHEFELFENMVNISIYSKELKNINYHRIFHNKHNELEDSFIESLKIRFVRLDDTSRIAVVHNMLLNNYPCYTLIRDSDKRKIIAEYLTRLFNLDANKLTADDVKPHMTNYQKENLIPESLDLIVI